jgi:galactokinase
VRPGHFNPQACINSTRELDLLVELARDQRGCHGAPLTGGGFGGATVNLVQESYVNEFIQNIAAKYEQRSGFTTRPFRCRIVDGAG